MSGKVFRYAVLMAAVSMAGSVPALAGDGLALPERWLDWRNNYAVYPTGLADCDAGAALGAEWDRSLQRLAAVIARSGGAVPAGIYGEFAGGVIATPGGQPCKGGPLVGFLDMGYWPERDVVIAAGARPGLKRDHGHHFVLNIRLNSFAALGDPARLPEFLREPGKWSGIGLLTETASLQGLPVYNNAALVVTPAGHAPAFVPVPLSRALKLWLPAQALALRDQEELLKQYPQDQREDLRKRIVAPQQGVLARGQALLSRGGSVLAGPAYLKLDLDSGSFEVVTQAGTDTSAIVMPNPAYFDPKLPRSAVQLMVVDVSGLNLDHPAARSGDAFDSTYLTRMFVEKVDWKAVASTSLR